MPQFLVSGADGRTGEDVETVIDATDKFNAERVAREGGMLVSGIKPLKSPLAYQTPTATPVVIHAAPPVQTTQRTSKKWKLLTAVSVLAIIVGGVTIGVSAGGEKQSSDGGIIGGLLLMLGILGFIIARIGAWWFHG